MLCFLSWISLYDGRIECSFSRSAFLKIWYLFQLRISSSISAISSFFEKLDFDFRECIFSAIRLRPCSKQDFSNTMCSSWLLLPFQRLFKSINNFKLQKETNSLYDLISGPGDIFFRRHLILNLLIRPLRDLIFTSYNFKKLCNQFYMMCGPYKFLSRFQSTRSAYYIHFT